MNFVFLGSLIAKEAGLYKKNGGFIFDLGFPTPPLAAKKGDETESSQGLNRHFH